MGPELVQSWAGAIAATCGALIGLGTISIAIYSFLPRGKTAVGTWVHEVSGANAVSANLGPKIEAVTTELAGLREDLGALAATQTTLAETQASNHRENQERDAMREQATGSLMATQERTQEALKLLNDEQVAEASERAAALVSVTATLERVATIAEHAMIAVEKHAAQRGKHVSTRKKATA